MIPNPDYKGKWVQPRIDNPAYKGEWAPRQIPNPNYYDDTKPADLEPIGALGFELWTMQSDILFDNVYLGHSIEEAEKIGNATFLPKLAIEQEQERAAAPKDTASSKKERKLYNSASEYFKDDPIGYVTEVFRVFVLNFSADPAAAVKGNPLVASAFAASVVFAFSIVFGIFNTIRFLIFSSKKPSASQPTGKKPDATSEEDKQANDSASATASGVANGRAAPVKRKA
jgi:calnexin